MCLSLLTPSPRYVRGSVHARARGGGGILSLPPRDVRPLCQVPSYSSHPQVNDPPSSAVKTPSESSSPAGETEGFTQDEKRVEVRNPGPEEGDEDSQTMVAHRRPKVGFRMFGARGSHPEPHGEGPLCHHVWSGTNRGAAFHTTSRLKSVPAMIDPSDASVARDEVRSTAVARAIRVKETALDLYPWPASQHPKETRCLHSHTQVSMPEGSELDPKLPWPRQSTSSAIASSSSTLTTAMTHLASPSLGEGICRSLDGEKTKRPEQGATHVRVTYPLATIPRTRWTTASASVKFEKTN